MHSIREAYVRCGAQRAYNKANKQRLKMEVINGDLKLKMQYRAQKGKKRCSGMLCEWFEEMRATRNTPEWKVTQMESNPAEINMNRTIVVEAIQEVCSGVYTQYYRV